MSQVPIKTLDDTSSTGSFQDDQERVNNSLFSVMFCVSADGRMLPLVMVYKSVYDESEDTYWSHFQCQQTLKYHVHSLVIKQGYTTNRLRERGVSSEEKF